MRDVSPSARLGHAVVYDSTRKRVLLFGGEEGSASCCGLGDTREWDGTVWLLKSLHKSPPSRYFHAMAYDSVRKRVVLFGGYNSSYLGDTWEWNRKVWVKKTSTTSPSIRYGHAMAYDSARRRMVLFGGYNGTNLGDTWEWSGKAWVEKAPLKSPPARYFHTMVYDSARRRVVLFGGSNGSNLGDTWEWDGTVWVEKTLTPSPSTRYGQAMVFDSAAERTVLFGGFGCLPSGSCNDIWEWDGTVWVEKASANTPAARYWHAMAYDSVQGRIVLFGGYNPYGHHADTWEWDGGAWVEKTPDTSPSPRSWHAMVYDSARERVVLFGGDDGSSEGRNYRGIRDDTWEWDGTAWLQKSPRTSPQGRFTLAMAYDSARERVVLFGGYGCPPSSICDDTWEWDGTTWVEMTPATSPSPRWGSAMAYDSARGHVVLFGGYNGLYLSDTWEWDGTNWTQVASAGPPARGFGPMVYDDARERVVLFGGSNGSYLGLGDTWEWDGTAWVEKTPATGPLYCRGCSAMVYDSMRRRVVLFGDRVQRGSSGLYVGGTFEWDGMDWVDRTSPKSPSARSGYAMAYDSAQERTVLFGGDDDSSFFQFFRGDTWEYPKPTHPR